MSPELKQFFLGIHEWVEQGCPEHEIFSKHRGLCSNLTHLCSSQGFDSFELKGELDFLLRTVSSKPMVPFNNSSNPYCSEIWDGTIYQNPHRLAFIKQQVELIKNA